ncbi:MAG: universal stress protein [Flavobacteriaceae bacterium]|nr:universal stress protein [Flavobacteriaceae bacterium]
MKNILLPTDFSENSQNAIEFALEFLKGKECSFSVLNVQKAGEFVLDDFYSASATSSVNEAILKDNKKDLKSFLSPFQEKYKNEKFEFQSFVDYDVFADAVSQLVSSENIDLIVMGSNGATDASEVLFGSNTLQVIRKVDCPVLIIPEDYKYSGIESVLFTASTCRDLKHEAAIPFKEILDAFEPELHLLNIKKSQKAPSHQCTSCLIDVLQDVDYTSHTLRGIPTPMAVDAFVQLNKVDLHATFVERESFMDRFLFGSETSKLSYGTRIPLLIMHK